MGERATCPVCGSHSSSVLYNINQGHDCESCGCPNILLKQHQDFLEEIDILKNKKIKEDILIRLQEYEKENNNLKTKINKLINILGYDFDSQILDSLKECIKIIHED